MSGPFARHVFVCTSGGTCSQQGGTAVHTALKEAVARAGLLGRVRINHAGCLDQCGHGPLVVVYPDDVWYAHVTPAEAERIVAEHLAAGRPVEALRFRPAGPGANKLPRDPQGRPLARCTTCRDGRAETFALPESA
jgi:(2Fe-2S) ferredoxin